MDLVVTQLHSIAKLPKGGIREVILGMQALLQDSTSEVPLDYFPVRHEFSPGTYAREMTIPEGTVIIGRIHKHAHLNIISAGECTVLTEFGVQHLTAPCMFTSEPGTKRVVVAHSTVVWTTVHATNLTDVDEIIREFTTDTYTDIEVFADYERVLP